MRAASAATLGHSSKLWKGLTISEREPLRPTSDSHRAELEEATARYQEAVTVEAVRYLTARGIGRPIALSARLGVVADPVVGHENFRGRLAIPYVVAGRPVSMRFRCMAAHDCKTTGCPKYLQAADDPTRMYNVGAITRATNEIEVTEGEFDALILEQLGYPAVAIPGVNNWHRHHRRMLAGFSRIRVWADPDSAGAELVHKVSRALRQARRVTLKEGDVTETYMAHGADAIRALREEHR